MCSLEREISSSPPSLILWCHQSQKSKIIINSEFYHVSFREFFLNFTSFKMQMLPKYSKLHNIVKLSNWPHVFPNQNVYHNHFWEIAKIYKKNHQRKLKMLENKAPLLQNIVLQYFKHCLPMTMANTKRWQMIHKKKYCGILGVDQNFKALFLNSR